MRWGTAATAGWTAEGGATSFIAVDPYTAAGVGLHAARRGTRCEVLEPLRQGLAAPFGASREQVAAGLARRHEHGSQFMSDHCQAERRFLGIASSPTVVREPEGNGGAERFSRTLTEQLLWGAHCTPVEERRQALLAFQERYHRAWLIGRHGQRSQAAVRQAVAAAVAA